MKLRSSRLLLGCVCSTLVLCVRAEALPVDPQPLPFYFEVGGKVVSGSISALTSDYHSLLIQLDVDNFRFKSLQVFVFAALRPQARVPTGAASLGGPGVDIQRFEIHADSVEVRFHNFGPHFASRSDPFVIRYAEELLPGDQLVLTLRKGGFSKTITARVVPEPSSALLLALGLALLTGAGRGQMRGPVH